MERLRGPDHFRVVVRGSITVFLLIAVALSGCVQRLERRLLTADEVRAAGKPSGVLKAHMKNGRVYVLSPWSCDDAARSVSGSGRCYDFNRAVLDSGSFTIALDSVALFESNQVTNSNSVAAMAVITGISVGLTIFCLSNPKACFGSCPTFFVQGQDDNSPIAEGFSASVAPSLEATDIDALYFVHPDTGQLVLLMTNEALETHVVRHADLLAASKGNAARVLPDLDRHFWQISEPAPPRRATTADTSILSSLVAFDHREYASLTDSSDLAAREEIELTFDTPSGGSPALALASRQTLLSTYLFYQMLAHMGTHAGEFLARLERNDATAHTLSKSFGERLGGIDILVFDSLLGDWTVVARVHETGPLATDIRLIPLPVSTEETITVRLCMARGHWRVDYTAIAGMINRCEPLRVHPSAVLRNREVSPADLASLLDSTCTAVTLPGDTLTLTYLLPEPATDYDYFLESRGYYLEWIREEWLVEENPMQAARMLLNPEQALRDLAPQFKSMENTIEETFWRSRYGDQK